MAEPTIMTATPSEESAVVDVVVLAFSGDPAARWSYPNPNQYLRHFPSFVRAMAGKAFEHGSADYAEGFSGAALWLPPDVHPEEDALTSLVQRTVPESVLEDVVRVMEQMGRYHLEEAHWYLPLIGVDPSRQGQGHGSALLRHALARCDRDHLPAYLESSNPRNISLYERHGFERLGTIQAGTSPPIVPMRRKAR